MLLTLLGNLAMFGSTTPPQTSSGDGVAFNQGYSGKIDEEKEFLKRQLTIKNDDEDLILILAKWVTENNN